MEEKLRSYEMLVIINPTLDEEASKGVFEKVKGFVTAEGGEIIFSSVWGKRRLAYEIKKFKRAQYVIYQFNLLPGSLKEVERRIKIDEKILRHLTLLIRPEMVIASGGSIVPSSEGTMSY